MSAIAAANPADDDRQDRLSFQGPVVKGGVLPPGTEKFAIDGPFSLRVDNGDIGVGAVGEEDIPTVPYNRKIGGVKPKDVAEKSC